MDKAGRAKKNSKKCSIPHCGKSYRTDVAIQLFEFPAPNTIMGQVWRVKCGFPTDASRLIICQNHFSPGCCGKRRLKKDSVPSLNLTAPIEGDSKSKLVEARMYPKNHQNREIIPDKEESNGYNSNDGIKIEEEESLVEDSVEYNVNYNETDDDQVPVTKRRRFYNKEPKTTTNGLDDIELCDKIETRIKDECQRISETRDNIDAKEEVEKTRTDNEVLHEALLCMKTLLERNSQRDEYSAFVEHIAHKLRTCKRDAMEIKIAQHYIENIIVNLSTGVYSQVDQLNDPSDCLDDQPKTPENQLLYSDFEPDIKKEPNF